MESEKRNCEKIVYIIGAGTSKGDGIPILDDLKTALRRLINDSTEYTEINRKKLEDTYKEWEENHSDKNIEKVMISLENENKQDVLDKFEYAYVAVIIYYAYYYDFYRNSRKERKHSTTYSKFIKKVLSDNADIISLNVDNQICDCVFKDEELNKIIETSKDMRKWLETQKSDIEKSPDLFELKKELVTTFIDEWPFEFHRIHGSISFPNHKKDSGHSIVISPNFKDLEEGKYRIEYPGYKEYKYFCSEFKNALSLIRKAEKIIIIGCSFPKSDITWGLELSKAISENKNNPYIEIVNPAIKSSVDIINNCLEIIPSKHRNRIRFNPITFEEFLED